MWRVNLVQTVFVAGVVVRLAKCRQLQHCCSLWTNQISIKCKKFGKIVRSKSHVHYSTPSSARRMPDLQQCYCDTDFKNVWYNLLSLLCKNHHRIHFHHITIAAGHFKVVYPTVMSTLSALRNIDSLLSSLSRRLNYSFHTYSPQL